MTCEHSPTISVHGKSITYMQGLTACGLGSHSSLRIHRNSSKSFSISGRRRHGPVPVLKAASDGPELDKWDQMELKFGRLIGEDPKLTLAKIMARKDNPEVSYLDVEKSFRKNKGKPDHIMHNMPADSTVVQEILSSQNLKFQKLPLQKNLNLSRPVMKKVTISEKLNEEPVSIQEQENQLLGNMNMKTSISNISLRKPSVFHADKIEADSSKLEIKPNLFFKMRKSPHQSSREVTLLKKPELIQVPLNPFEESISCAKSVDMSSTCLKALDNVDNLKNIETVDVIQQDSFERSANYDMMTVRDNETEGTLDDNSDFIHISSELNDSFLIGLQPPMQKGDKKIDAKCSSTLLHENSICCKSDYSMSAATALLDKPHRQNSDKEVLHPAGLEATSSSDKTYSNSVDAVKFQSAEEEESEENYWNRAENLLKGGEKAEVELISCSSRGFVASLGSLIGFLPYRNLGTKWKYLAFESWLRKKGLDPSVYRLNFSIVGNYDGQSKNLALEDNENIEKDKVSESDVKFKGLLEAYEQEKTKYLSSFVGQRLGVSIILADRSSRRLMFSVKPKENKESVKKKRSLMARLSVGDIVKCCIKKISYFGIFVEVEGVPALIHQSEMSWNSTLDPSSFFKIGQVVDAKVYQLDFALERITLSLKEVTVYGPDPLMETLESVVDGRTLLGESLESGKTDVEWPDVDFLIKELQRVEGVHNVTKGRFFLSPGLAPTFQVYMASMFNNQYKLLARCENRVQEVIVQATLDKEQLKDAIWACTNRLQ